MHKHIAIISLALSYVVGVAVIARAETEIDLINLVVDAMCSNEKELGPVYVVLRWSHFPDEDAKKLPDKIIGAAGDGTIEIEVAKERSSSTLPLLLDVGFFECLKLDEKGNLLEMSRLEDGLWTEYQPEMNRILVRRADQLPDIGPYDPRQLASGRHGRAVADLLQPDQVVKVERFDDEVAGAKSIRVQLRGGAIEFASRARFLPCHARHVNVQGQIIDDLRITYQPSGRGTSLLLKSATTILHPAKPELKAFAGKLVLSVDEFELISSEDVKNRKLELPKNVPVQDLSMKQNQRPPKAP